MSRLEKANFLRNEIIEQLSTVSECESTSYRTLVDTAGTFYMLQACRQGNFL